MREPPPPPPPLWLRAAVPIIRRLPRGRYRTVQWLRSWLRGPYTVRMPGNLGGSRFVCRLQRGHEPEVWLAGVYEPQETALVRTLLQPGMTFVDVGANWGYFTLLAAARVGPHGTVVALEADPRTYPVLCANVELNAFPQVSTLPMASADRAGVMPLDGRGDVGREVGVARLDWGSSPPPDAHTVATGALDDVLDEARIARVHLLKMDIEGAEVLALRGLRRSLAAGRVDRVILELHPIYLAEMGSSHALATDLLRAAGYAGWTIDHSPARSRVAHYSRRLEPRAWIRPLDPREPLDAWPHQLWVRPGLDPL